MLPYNPENEQPPRLYTEMQQKILDTVESFGGDAVAAARAAGYSNPERAVTVLKKELIEIAEGIIARTSIKAAMKVAEMIDSKEPIAQAEAKLKAATLILERTNPKTDKVDISGEVKGGIFILPEKRPVGE